MNGSDVLIDFILVLPLDGSAGFPLPFILPKSRARDGLEEPK
jgi:hypothetical protein